MPRANSYGTGGLVDVNVSGGGVVEVGQSSTATLVLSSAVPGGNSGGTTIEDVTLNIGNASAIEVETSGGSSLTTLTPL